MQLVDGIAVNELERRMRPGGWSQEGFITPDQSLIKVLVADMATVQKLGVTPQGIAESLERLIERGAHGEQFIPAQVEHFNVRIIHSRKMRTCPWAQKQFERCNFGMGVKYLTTEDFEITNTRLGESLTGTSLCIHLIRDHSFFGGPGTAYRIDPERAVRVLELVRDINNK